MALMFLERLSKNGIEESPFFKRWGTSGDMPNCTRYAYDRTQEACDNPNIYIARPESGFDTAKKWWYESPYPKGSEIRCGAVAVFDGKDGHVCYVERVTDKAKNKGLISQSQWDANKNRRDYKYFETKEITFEVGKPSMSGIGNFLGFIYSPINDIRVARNQNNQIEIIESMVNVRKTPEGDLTRVGCFCPMGFYDVLERQTVNGYVWYKIDGGCWVREGSWLREYNATDDDYYKELYWAEVEENKKLKNQLDEIARLCEYE